MSAYGRLPVSISRGEGVNLWDDQGREYLDALSGIAVCGLGHANKAMAEALTEQVNTLLHISNLYREPLQESLGEQLCKVAGMDKAFFCNSGAESNEACIKIARLHGHAKNIDTPTVIVTETAFHGRTLATIAATGNDKIQKGFGPLTPGFVVVPYDDVEAIKKVATERDDIVAILLEPVQGEGGIQVPADDYLEKVRAICDEQDWLLMLDEIQSGMGRTGKWFAHQHTNIQPDVMSVAKALGNGIPVGACLARGKAAELIQPGSHGTTFGGNPMASRAGLTVIQEMEKHQLVDRAAELGDRIQSGLRNRLHNRQGVVEVRGKGLMIGVELDRPCAELVQHALDAGLLINVAAGNVVRLLPPLVLSDDQADKIINTVSDLVIAFLDKENA
ncbi:UNVERIFIED_CONTAM: hypothetical protein GTU68_008038 [Idotea baltica]|nr:hypothetical protein [Idotea baltica]